MFYIVLLTILSTILLASKLRPNSSILEIISISYFLGFGLTTYISFLLHIYVGIPFSTVTYIFILVLIFILGLVLEYKNFRKNGTWQNIFTEITTAFSLRSVQKKWWVIAAFIPALFAVVVTSFWPVRDWDALTLYDFRGKAIYETQSLEVLLEQYSEYYFAYPLYTSLAHTYLYSLGVVNPLPFYALNLLFFQLIFFSLLKHRTSFFIAVLGTFIVGFSYPIFSNALMAYTNLPYSIFILLGIFYTVEWFERPSYKSLWLLLLFTGFGLWTRNAEPFWMISLILIAIKSYQSKTYTPLLLAVILNAVFIVPWQIYTSFQVEVTRSTTLVPILEGIKIIDFSYFLYIIKYLFKYFVSPLFVLHAVFSFSVLSALKGTRLVNLPLALAISLSYGMVLAGTILLSLTYTKWMSVGGSLERMSVLFIPLIIFYSAEVISKLRNQQQI